LTATNNQIEELTEQIAAESRRMAAHTQAKHEETQRRIEAARDAVTTIEERVNSLQIEKKNVTVEADTVEREGRDLDRKRIEFQNRIQECEQMIQAAKNRENDALIPYGKDIKKVLEVIKKMRWFGDEPLGPLGVHVKAKDPAKWGGILRNQLSSFLTAFAVTDARDRIQLKKLFHDSGKWVATPTRRFFFQLTSLKYL
jgi:chromosome segregation ATPase